MEAQEAGALFSFAVTVGVHRIMTVHGHTDEGGFMRDVLRSVNFGDSYGGLVMSVEPYTGIPLPHGGLSGFVKVIDAIAFTTAGAVAMADPLTEVDGRLYPTILDTFREGGPVDGSPTDNLDAQLHIRTIAGSCTQFSQNYVSTLARVFCNSGGERLAKLVLNDTFNSIVGESFAHLKYRVVAPFFWIEPTGSVHLTNGDSEAAKNGYAQLCTPYQSGQLPAFSGAVKVGESAVASGYLVDWVTARKHGMLHHLCVHKLDGLANVVIRQIDGNATTLCGRGPEDAPYLHVNERVGRKMDVGSYLWGRGHSSVIAPAEVTYIGKKVGLVFKHSHVINDGLLMETTHFPRPEEIDQLVTFSVTRMGYQGEVKKGAPDRMVCRERKAANVALHAARLQTTVIKHLDAFMPMLAVDPGTGLAIGENDVENGLEDTLVAEAKHRVPKLPIVSNEERKVGMLTNETVKINPTMRSGAKIGPDVSRSKVDSAPGITTASNASHADPEVEAEPPEGTC
jgi:hypothetical protein